MSVSLEEFFAKSAVVGVLHCKLSSVNSLTENKNLCFPVMVQIVTNAMIYPLLIVLTKQCSSVTKGGWQLLASE